MGILEKLAQPLLKKGLCHFQGAVFDESNSELIYHSDLCVSPGNVGLTAIHSLTYGVPVATHTVTSVIRCPRQKN